MTTDENQAVFLIPQVIRMNVKVSISLKSTTVQLHHNTSDVH